MRALLMSCLCLILLSGCLTPRITGQVQSFSVEEAFEDAPRVYVTSGSGLTDNSLEFQSYRDLLVTHLQDAGMQPVTSIKDAYLIAELSYEIDEGSTVIETRESPRHFYPYGFYGVGSSRSHRQVGANVTFPLTSSERTTIRRDVYTRTVSLTFLRKDDSRNLNPEHVYEGKIVSKGSCPLLSQVMPEMLEGLFLNFPNTSGAVEIESLQSCNSSAAK